MACQAQQLLGQAGQRVEDLCTAAAARGTADHRHVLWRQQGRQALVEHGRQWRDQGEHSLLREQLLQGAFGTDRVGTWV
ncbi:hypothetical protein D3C75_1036360 [compost metagenome]